jgi:hypothetical protein
MPKPNKKLDPRLAIRDLVEYSFESLLEEKLFVFREALLKYCGSNNLEYDVNIEILASIVLLEDPRYRAEMVEDVCGNPVPKNNKSVCSI